MHRIFGIIAVCSLMLVATGAAAQSPGNAFAVVRDNELFVTNLLDVYNKVNNPPHAGFLSLAWSPDGAWLAYIIQDENFETRLRVAPAGGGDSIALDTAGRLEAGFPVAWTPNNEILYAQSTNPNVNINTLRPAADAQPITLGSVPFGVGCGGGSPWPTDWQYGRESGAYLTLAWTDYGVLHSVQCGGAGAALLDVTTGQTRSLTPDGDVPIGRLALAADGQTVAGIKTAYVDPNFVSSLVLIDLASGTITDVATAAQPEQIAWGWTRDNLCYSTRTPTDRNLLAPLAPEQVTRVEQVLGAGVSLPVFNVAIHCFAAGVDTRRYGPVDAYQIGRLRTLTDGSVWFSQIPNLDAWLVAVGSGMIDYSGAINLADELATVPVSVWRLDSGTVELQGDGLEQFTPRQ